MRQLISLGARLLATETARQDGHAFGIAVLDPSTAPGGKGALAEINRLIVAAPSR